jgi:SAM-dependent methyltransferase
MIAKLLLSTLPPILYRLPIWAFRKLKNGNLPTLPPEYQAVRRGHHCLFKLVRDYDFDTVLDIGAGAGSHSDVLSRKGKTVTAIDFGTSVYAADRAETVPWRRMDIGFYEFDATEQFDCIWASHVLEHQPDPGVFIRRCIKLTKPDGIIAITVPPLKHRIVGGHLSLWNAGLLLYQLTFNGLDTQDAAICTYGYNVSVIVRNRKRQEVELDFDKGDISKLQPFMPSFVNEPFDGRVYRWNW